MLNFIAVFLGGGLGASLRYLITQISKKIWGFALFGTFCSNLLGCFLIGFIFGITMNKINIFSAHLKLFMTVGFLGGLTTFSTFSVEAFYFLRDGKIINCILYVAITFFVCLCATAAGYLFGKNLV